MSARPPEAVASLSPIAYKDLPGWGETEAVALLSGVSRHAVPAIFSRRHEAPWLADLAGALQDGLQDARATVERIFQPLRIGSEGFLTGYYEPVVTASRVREGPFQTPLYRRPDDLVRVDPPEPSLPGDGTFARMVDGKTEAYPDRTAISEGALDGKGLELAFLADPVDAFFIQVQGSARLVFPDGTATRIGYHGKTGHSYTAIGRVLIDRGFLPEGGATMQTIRAILAARPDIVPGILAANRSYVFFRERPDPGRDLGPIAAGGLPLVPLRSLAVDRAHIKLGTPVYVETDIPRRGPHNGVMIAEDTGSAIIGPARGDVFMGSGDGAGAIAGEMKAAATLTLFLPRAALP
ncbi:MAG: MltA domain-containing protein [Pseudomonadota bacterium]